ncbi:MAG TPA: nucleotide exchange factor GrpE [Acidimicrobiia bacterium]|jgi:molecular chaperone GrpE
MSPDRFDQPEIVDDHEDAGTSADDFAAVDGEVIEATHIDPASLGLDLSADPEAARQELLGALIEARLEAAEYLETLQRVAADFDNYRKRVERDQADVVHRATRHLVERLLPSLESLDAALSYETQTPTEEKILDGVRGTHTQLMDMLAKEGLQPIEAVGTTFDPALHEAVSGTAGDGDLTVTQELRRGYTLGGRVIRPSLVVVESSGQ